MLAFNDRFVREKKRSQIETQKRKAKKKRKQYPESLTEDEKRARKLAVPIEERRRVKRSKRDDKKRKRTEAQKSGAANDGAKRAKTLRIPLLKAKL